MRYDPPMHINWLRILAILFTMIMWTVIFYAVELFVARIPRRSLLGRLIAAERRWCWNRGGNWWRGGIPPQEQGVVGWKEPLGSVTPKQLGEPLSSDRRDLRGE
jgi:hypothetical protein